MRIVVEAAFIIAIGITSPTGALCSPDPVLRLPFVARGGWSIDATGPWWAHIDRRNLLNLFHSLVSSEAGAYAGATRKVAIPAHWRPPFALRFYWTDSYCVPGFPNLKTHAESQSPEMADDYPGHRFKQVLVDGAVIWESDVSDELRQLPYVVDLTDFVRPGRAFTLTFRLLDRVATCELLPYDVRYRQGDSTEPEPRFATAAYVGDVVIGEAAAVCAAPAEPMPSDAIVAARHEERWPLQPLGKRQELPAKLPLVTLGELPAIGFPLVCTVPFGPGTVYSDRFSLRASDGSPRLLQSEVMSRWPDGSIRWLMLNSTVSRSSAPGETWSVEASPETAHAGSVTSRRVSVSRDGSGVSIRTGAVTIKLGADTRTLVDSVAIEPDGAVIAAGLQPEMVIEQNGRAQRVAATRAELRVVREGPVRATVEAKGSLDTRTEHVGEFVFRLDAYAGLPIVSLQYRIVNHVMPEPYTGLVTDPPLSVKRLALVAHLPGERRGPVRFGVGDEAVEVERPDATLRQGSPERLAVGCRRMDGQLAAGWVCAATDRGAVQADVWRFWQQYPKALVARGSQLRLELFAPSAAMPRYRPRFGEAKRHDVLLTFLPAMPTPAESRAISAAFQHPPRLFERSWFANSGGLTPVDTGWYERTASVREWLRTNWGTLSADKPDFSTGIRDYGDRPYGTEGMWFADYCYRMDASYVTAIATGLPAWFERGAEIARHVQDVDQVHIPCTHPLWAERGGATITQGYDHSAHAGHSYTMNPAYQAGSGLLTNWWLTGDPDSLEAGLANVDYIVRNMSGYAEPAPASSRCQTRPLEIARRAWEATGDTRYLETASWLVGLLRERFTDPRRGGFVHGIYRNWAGIEVGLDSMQAAALYDYYRLTGDLRAAKLVVARAEAAIGDCMLPQPEGLGDFLFYPRYSRYAGYSSQMAWLMVLAYDLTGDEQFLRIGRAAMDRYMLYGGFQAPDNAGHVDPIVGHWLQELASVQTEPFTVTQPVTDPDPTNFGPIARR